uniref:Single domain major allergen protein n=1 Tax=Antheraea yamamai TaxID=7121 RepID=A0A161H9I2_ANTYA|nr:single domain major allergen protein [Antheraea yamamai]
MKVAFIVLALSGLAFSAPQPKKLFHEHFEDFMDLIVAEVGEELSSLSEQYIQYDEFLVSANYLISSNFKDLVYEMEFLPEFQAVVDFLENDNIDILYFINIFNEFIDSFEISRKTRQQATGKDFNSFINDSINLFPKEKLAALYDQKMSEDEGFRVAMENLSSDEWSSVFNALWQSEIFQSEVNSLNENGINIHLLLNEILAIFGQN